MVNSCIYFQILDVIMYNIKILMTCQTFNEVVPVLNLKYYTKLYSYRRFKCLMSLQLFHNLIANGLT